MTKSPEENGALAIFAGFKHDQRACYGVRPGYHPCDDPKCPNMHIMIWSRPDGRDTYEPPPFTGSMMSIYYCFEYLMPKLTDWQLFKDNEGVFAEVSTTEWHEMRAVAATPEDALCDAILEGLKRKGG